MAEGYTPVQGEEQSPAQVPEQTTSPKRRLGEFTASATSPDYVRAWRAPHERVTRLLAAALTPQALASPTYRSDLLKALRQVSKWVDALTHSTNRNDFENYLALANRKRLRVLLGVLLHGDAPATAPAAPAAERIDTFKREIDQDYAELLQGHKHITLGLISLLLAVTHPAQHLLYRLS